MTPEQNKNYILNNLDDFVIDDRGEFVNLKKDYSMNDYVIWKINVKDYEKVEEKVIESILKDKSRWSKVFGKKVTNRIARVILSEKEGWELITYSSGHPTGLIKNSKSNIEINLNLWNGSQKYFLIGEFGYRGGDESIWKDYDECRDWILELIEKELQSKQPKKDQKETKKLKKQLEEERKKIEEQAKNNPPTSTPQPEKIPPTDTENPQQNNNPKPTSPLENNPTNPPQNQEDEENNNQSHQSQTTVTNKKNQINQVLKSHHLKTSDLPKEYQNWEEQLSKLKSKEEINAFVAKINQQIEQKAKELKEQKQKGNNNQQPLSWPTKLLIGGGIVGLIVFVFLISRVKKRKK